jgi:release factor glutamine methyltransferase
MSAKAELFVADSLSWWLDIATTRLDVAGVASPRHDAERLAAHALGLTWSDLVASRRDIPLASTVLTDLERFLVRREGGEPLAYIEGSRGFYGLELACGPGVLVPRPETEVLVTVGLELIEGTKEPIVVDLGTGTGAAALAIATERPDAHVIATDISDEALVYARTNARTLGIDVWFSSGDLFEAVPDEVHGRVDLIVSNPPYVPLGSGLAADVHAEPAVAVFGGPGGMHVLTRIVDEAPSWLKPGGALALEFGDAWQSGVLLDGRPGAEVRNDLTGRPRVVWARF